MAEPLGPEGAVTVAYVHQNEVASCWHHSVVQMIAHDLEHELRVMRGGWVPIRCGTGGLVESRNLAVKTFLAEKETDWLLWVDTDMGFPEDIVDRLFEVADARHRPMVGALCFSQREVEPDGLGGWRTAATPTIFDFAEIKGQKGFAVRWEYAANTVVRCSGTGSACVLIHRSVFARVEAKMGPVWYDRVPNTSTGQLISEDLSFCLRVGSLGIPIHVHTGVEASHQKVIWLTERTYLQERIADRALSAPPAPIAAGQRAIEPTAIIVPTRERPGSAAPFMESLRATAPAAIVYAVLHRDDPSKGAWLEAGAKVVLGDVTYWSEKCNLGYRSTEEPWLFFTGDDVRFQPGWLEEAQRVAAERNASVVGTHDGPGGNPRVAGGDHAVHWLVRRSYIDELGASWDGPGVVCHEGYRCWYADDEVVTAAKQRGQWAPALASVVEHLHPLFGKGNPDEVYTVNQDAIAADRALFEGRLRASLLELAGVGGRAR